MMTCSIHLLKWFVLAVGIGVSCLATALPPIAGHVVDNAGASMEGVLVIAQADGETVLTAVSSDANGYFRFPERLVAGRYQLRVRATGYRLTEPVALAHPGNGEAEARVVLTPVTDVDALAAQLTSFEWLRSFPGSHEQKSSLTRNLVGCHFCHSLERVARSTHDADALMAVIQRMKTYESDHSSAERIQVVAAPEPLDGLDWHGRDAAEMARYMASVNLSAGRDQWTYSLQTASRPSGEATRAVITVFSIPRQPSVIHDLDVDELGRVWYGNTGWDYLGMLDPVTAEFSEWEAPNFLPDAAPGLDRIVGVQDIQVGPDGRVWSAIMGNKHAAFVPDTARWQIYDLPVIWKNPFLGPLRNGEPMLWATGITALPEGPIRHEHGFGLDTRTGVLSPGLMLFDDKPTPVSPYHRNLLNYCYMMDQDADGRFLCTAPEPSAIARADNEGRVRLVYTPTRHAYPRRGYRDDQNRFWFAEFYADKVGMIDLSTDQITEYPLNEPFLFPYYARPDNAGRVWISSTGSDYLLKLDIASGQFTRYLMPVEYDARKVVVDEQATHTTIWLPNKNAGQLIRVEVPAA